MAKISIKGLKISEVLFLVRLRTTPPENRLLPAFCSLLAGSRINMPFLSTVSRAGGLQVTCCVDAAQRVPVEQLINAHPILSQGVEYTPGIGLLTLFPHQSNLKLLGLSLSVLAKADIRVYALASSIGALTYVLDHSRLDKATAALQTRFELAENHAPFRAEFVVSQGTQTRPGDLE
jgi:aspartokinase